MIGSKVFAEQVDSAYWRSCIGVASIISYRYEIIPNGLVPPSVTVGVCIIRIAAFVQTWLDMDMDSARSTVHTDITLSGVVCNFYLA